MWLTLIYSDTHSIVTHLRCGGIFIDRFIENFLEGVSVKVLKIVQYCKTSNISRVSPLQVGCPLGTNLPDMTLLSGPHECNIQLQYNCNTRIFFLYCNCIALVRTALGTV